MWMIVFPIVMSFPKIVWAQTPADSLLFVRINEYRAEAGLGPVVWDSCLYRAAQYHTIHMARVDKVLHRQPSKGLKDNWNMDPSDRMEHFCARPGMRLIHKQEIVDSFMGSHSPDIEEIVGRLIWGWDYSAAHKEVLTFRSPLEADGLPIRGAAAVVEGCFQRERGKLCGGYGTFVVSTFLPDDK
jgi:hypothetical protein